MKTEFLCLLCIVLINLTLISEIRATEDHYFAGVWNNFDFHHSPKEWVDAAHRFGGDAGMIDLVVAQANIDGRVYLPFPLQSNGHLYGYFDIDKAESYLQEFDIEGVAVILSIQPLKANITQLLEILLARYSHHENIRGINIDLEWKESGTPHHVNNEELDSWLNQIREYNSHFTLFLTFYMNYTHFPQDHDGLVILYDGAADTQTNLLNQYQELAQRYLSVGIYTGYSSSIPPTLSHERIMKAVPHTQYIIHTDDVFYKLNWTLYFGIGVLILGIAFILKRVNVLKTN